MTSCSAPLSSRFLTALRTTLITLGLIAVAPAAMAQAPAQPDSVTVTAVSGQTITVQAVQNNTTNLDHFVCQVSTDNISWSDNPCTQTGNVGATYTLSLTGLTNKQIYYVQVAASDSSNQLSAYVAGNSQARPVAYRGPDAPANGSAISPADGEITITWTDPAELGYGGVQALTVATSIDSFWYQIRTSSSGAWSGWSVVTPIADSSPLELTGLPPNTRYDVEIRARNNLSFEDGPTLLLTNILASPFAMGAANLLEVPTLGEWGVMILSLLLAASVILTRRRQRH